MWRLKSNIPAFEMVSGPMAGRKFDHGKVYSDIQESELDKFCETVTETHEPASADAKNQPIVEPTDD